MENLINPPRTTRDDDMQAGDAPFTTEELATQVIQKKYSFNHTCHHIITTTTMHHQSRK
jgi:hypothetical protein